MNQNKTSYSPFSTDKEEVNFYMEVTRKGTLSWKCPILVTSGKCERVIEYEGKIYENHIIHGVNELFLVTKEDKYTLHKDIESEKFSDYRTCKGKTAFDLKN